MEDAHTTLTTLETPDDRHVSLFAVFDGHGGSHAAKYSGANLHLNIAKTESFLRKEYSSALKQGFLNTDSNLRSGILFTHKRSYARKRTQRLYCSCSFG
jgi:serine/threonine protein phosphatase PrpC